MRLVTKNIVRQIFSDIARAHWQIHSFSYGHLWELPQLLFDENTQELVERRRYPILFVSPQDDLIQGKTVYYNYKIVIADLVRTGEQNQTEVESDTYLIIQDVIAKIQDQSYGFILDTSNITIEVFKEAWADLLTGHIANVRVYTGYEYNRCQIPMDFISISNPYIPLDEEGINERDPLSWHRAGNALNYEAVFGTTTNFGWRWITDSLTRWFMRAAGHIVPAEASTYDIGEPALPLRAIYVDEINGNPVPSATVVFDAENVTTTIQDNRLIGGSLEKIFLFMGGTEQVSIGNVFDYDAVTGTITFAADLGGQTVKVQYFP